MTESVASIGGVDIAEMDNLGATAAGPWAVLLVDGNVVVAPGDVVVARIRADQERARAARYAAMTIDELEWSDYGRRIDLISLVVLIVLVLFLGPVFYFAFVGGQ